jgi:RNA polymerase sigma factor (sigma-70 family)
LEEVVASGPMPARMAFSEEWPGALHNAPAIFFCAYRTPRARAAAGLDSSRTAGILGSMEQGATLDLGLWRAARAGDAQARSQLAELALEIATRELRVRRSLPGDVEDLAQETVRQTLDVLSRTAEEPRDLRGFLKYRAWGVLSDRRKKKRVDRSSIDEANAPEPAVAGRGPVGHALERALLDALSDCRKRLGSELGSVLRLRFEAQRETHEIADELDVHRNTIRVRVFRALAQLHDCLTSKGFDAGDLGA